MTMTLKPGLHYEFSYTVPEDKTVPALYPEAEEFQSMPHVFATGYLVGFLEWACIKAINPHIDWPREQTLGTYIDVTHEAATPPGMLVTAKVKLVRVDARRLTFEVEARDEQDLIARGRHERYIVTAAKFKENVAKKTARKSERVGVQSTTTND